MFSTISAVSHVIKQACRPRNVVVHRALFFRQYASTASEPAFSTLLLSDLGAFMSIIATQSLLTLCVDDSVRVNEVGIQQLSQLLHRQVFPHSAYTSNPHLVALSRKHLETHNLLGKESAISPPINFDLPPLQGNTLDEHFHVIAMDAAEPYISMSIAFANVELTKPPKEWVRRSGWTRYAKDGTTERVPYPAEDCLVFDCETLYKESPFPVLACAASSEAWYGWLSPWLLYESESSRHLIPLGSEPSKKRIIIGHNVGYDRQRIKEEYHIQETSNAFIDTMSLHVAVNGMCSRQRPTWMKHQKRKLLKEKLFEEASASLRLSEMLGTLDAEDEISELWIARSSINSLTDVAHFHCNIKLDKTIRDYFGELDRAGVNERFTELMSYCASDVSTTHKVYRVVLPAFLDVCPHPVSFVAMLRLSSVFLPVDRSWEKYIETAESTYLKLSADVQIRLKTLAEKALDFKEHPDKWTRDPWLSQLDWSSQEIRMLKPKKAGDVPRPVKNQKKPGMPKWYKDLFPTNNSPMNLTVRSRIAPILLRLAWEGNPLVWSDKYGWVFRVTDLETAENFRSKRFTLCDMSDEPVLKVRLDDQGVYFKVPHKDGPSKRVANPMAKGYIAAFEEGTLSSEFEYAKEALDMNAACSYWISARERIKSQMVVWDTDTDMGLNGPKTGFGIILPQIIPMGTITRRAVENTWLTASNAKRNRVGSELKAMVKAPDGYKFVGADVDSEELWIASLFGDAEFGLHGATAIGWMTLEGTKAAGTDLHSKTAQILGISRNDAKVFNYGRIYGAGLKFAIQLLHQFNPSISDVDAERVATELYESTKGQKSKLKAFNGGRPFWRGGTESVVFNKLEAIAEQDVPRTPVLSCAITEALMQRYINKGGFMPSRINWVIQSSGVDYLHLLVVSMQYLIKKYAICARLSITVHDEIRYIVKEEDAYRAAMALQISNLWTRAMFSEQVGINDVPQVSSIDNITEADYFRKGVAFFSSVDVDKVLRKEVNIDCVTPSHHIPIPHGESLNIYQLLSHSNAKLVPTDNTSTQSKARYEPRKKVLEGPQPDLEFLNAQITSVERRSPSKRSRSTKPISSRLSGHIPELRSIGALKTMVISPAQNGNETSQIPCVNTSAAGPNPNGRVNLLKVT